MKIRYFLVVFLACTGILNAQEVKWSPIIEDRDNSYMQIIGQNEDGFYALRSNISFKDERDKVGFRDRRYNLTYYTTEMISKWSRNLESPISGGKIISVNLVDERVLVTYSFADKKTKIYRIYGQYLADNGIYADSAKLITETGYSIIDDQNKPDVYISQNQSRIALVYRTLPSLKDQQDYHIILLDSALAVLYRKDFTVPFNERNFVAESISISNDGGFYLFGTRYLNERKVKTNNERFYMTYFSSNQADETHNTELNPYSSGSQRFLNDAVLTYDNINHKIVVAGFYSEVSPATIAGTFYYSLRTDTLQDAMVSIAPFDQRFLSRFRGEVDKNNELTDYSVRNLKLRRDGGAVLVAEATTISYSNYYDYFSQMYITHKYYTYGNIIALSLNPDGSIHWNNVISKDQQSTDDGAYYSSYCSSIYGDKMYFIYNKHVDESPSVLISYINGKGEQRTDVLFNQEEHVRSIASSGKQIAENETVLPALKEGKLRFVKIIF